MHRCHHSTIEEMAGLVHAGRVDENDLAFGTRDDPLNLESGGLWFVGNGGDLFADKAVEKSRFAGIRSPDQRGVTAAKIGLRHYRESNKTKADMLQRATQRKSRNELQSSRCSQWRILFLRIFEQALFRCQGFLVAAARDRADLDGGVVNVDGVILLIVVFVNSAEGNVRERDERRVDTF